NARAAFLAGRHFLDQGDGRQPEPIGAGVESPASEGAAAEEIVQGGEGRRPDERQHGDAGQAPHPLILLLSLPPLDLTPDSFPQEVSGRNLSQCRSTDTWSIRAPAGY